MLVNEIKEISGCALSVKIGVTLSVTDFGMFVDKQEVGEDLSMN